MCCFLTKDVLKNTPYSKSVVCFHLSLQDLMVSGVKNCLSHNKKISQASDQVQRETTGTELP